MPNTNSRDPDRGFDYAHAVGTKRPNPWGIYDMHGNVYEFTQDALRPYSGAAQTDPQGPRGDTHCVSRGGGHHDPAWYARSAARASVRTTAKHHDQGARLLIGIRPR